MTVINFLKKNPGFKKAIKLFVSSVTSQANSTCMKKGSVTSKLTFSFFVFSKFKMFRQRQLLQYAESHYCRSMPRGGGCHASGLTGHAS
jgi:hypothetical protein